ncbi:hypothetical protein J4471_04985 [Candidatus Woesearchaeota archaeon]|nr:hypothetical protein [Candidatus Woesearchaeota archaeon]
MNLDRRNFFKYIAVIGAGTLITRVGLDLNTMEQYAEINGNLLADLHVHHKRSTKLEDKLATCSQGINGITSFMDVNIFHDYHDFAGMPGVREIDLGIYAKVDYNGQSGYILRTQEIQGIYPKLHILSVGVRDRIEDNQDPRRIVEEIHKRNGVAILNHPYVVPSDDLFRYRLLDADEEKVMLEVLKMVDEVEVNNGQCINLFFGMQLGIFGRVNMKKANKKAENLLDYVQCVIKGMIGTAASDAKHISQVRSSGIWIPINYTESIDGIKYCIRSKEFKRQNGVVSIPSFVSGHFGH